MREGLVDAVDENSAVGQTGQSVVGRLLGEGRLGVLQVGHACRLSVAEPGDLAVLGSLCAEVGEGETRELLTVHVEARRSDEDRSAVAVGVDEIQLDGGTESAETVEVLRSDGGVVGYERREG